MISIKNTTDSCPISSCTIRAMKQKRGVPLTRLNQLSSQLGRKDEAPNIELAEQLVKYEDLEGINEVIQNLHNPDKKIQQDCMKVVYEIGKRNPHLIQHETETFLSFLKSRNNRMVWGAMTALSTVAHLSSSLMMNHLRTIFTAIQTGSVITVDKGIFTLATLASVNESNNRKIFPFLLNHLETCRPKEVPQHAESTMRAVTEENVTAFLTVLKKREPYLTPPQLKRIKRIYKTFETKDGKEEG